MGPELNLESYIDYQKVDNKIENYFLNTLLLEMWRLLTLRVKVSEATFRVVSQSNSGSFCIFF